MKIRRIKAIKVNSFSFTIKWNAEHNGAEFDYGCRTIEIGTKGQDDSLLMMLICHELQEICAIEMNVRFRRPDVADDYIFVYDHRQHAIMINMFSALLVQFIK